MTNNGPWLKQELLSVGFERDITVFADSQIANNKLNLDYETLSAYPQILGSVVEQLADKAATFEPEFVAGVPHGATGLAQLVASELSDRQDKDIFQVRLTKDKNNVIGYEKAADHMIVSCLERGVFIEDVLNRGGSTKRALRLKDMAPRILGVIAVFDRGLISERNALGLEVHSLVQEPIPPQLEPNSPLWDYA